MDDRIERIDQLIDISCPGRNDLERVAQEIARQNLAIPIDNLATTRRDRHDCNPIAVGTRRQSFMAIHLQYPKSKHQNAKAGEYQCAGDQGTQQKTIPVAPSGFFKIKHVSWPASLNVRIDVVEFVLRKSKQPTDNGPEQRS